jgi:hypothetical protein
MSDAILERRYRRLLTCYPVEHRRVYGEEMIGVLIASTPNGQRRPDLADTLNMFGGGLRVRLRGLVTGAFDPAWSNALALATLIVPVLLAVLAWQQIGLLGPPGPPQSASTERLAEVAFLLVPLALGLLKLRNLASAAAIATLIWMMVAALAGGQLADPSQSAYLVLLAVQVLALTVSPGPAHALTLITAKNVGLAVPWLLGAAYLARVIPTHYPVPLIVAETGIGLIALAALPALATPGGRRLFVIIGVIPLSALVTTILTFAGVQFYALSPVTQLVALYLPPVALATLTCLVARRAPGPQAGVAG